jgi:hypothetical protein
VVGDFSRGFGGERRARGNSIIIFAFVLSFFVMRGWNGFFGVGTGKDEDMGPVYR